MKFSALLCCYHANDPDEVTEALESAFVNQTLAPSELVVVYDGPVPGSVEKVIDNFSKHHATQIIRFPENRGHGPARAAGVEAARHEWIAIIDADDVSLPGRFERLVQEIEAFPGLAVVGGEFSEFVDTPQGRDILTRRTYPLEHEAIRHLLSTRSPVAQASCMLCRDAVLEVGNYQSWFNNEDYHLWIRLVAAGFKFQNVAEQVLLVRVSPDVYFRRGGLRYWWNEVRLQAFSRRMGTTTLVKLLSGASARFVIQVVLTNKLRAAVYKHLLR